VQVNRSAIKRRKQNEKRRLRNRIVKAKIKTWARKIRESVANNKKDDALKVYEEYISLVDRAVSKGVYHKNNAARKKIRLYHLIKTLEKKK
jgi:small subunit ribosomal protein S20